MTTTDPWTSLQPKLHPEILHCLQDQMKFQFMMPVQKATIPMFLKNFDVAVEAQTGSGKTLAFLLPIFNALLMNKSLVRGQTLLLDQHSIYAVVIAPTRELAKQIAEVAATISKHLKFDIHVQVCIGGSQHTQDVIRMSEQGCNILIGSPGKLRQIFEDNDFNLKFAKNTLEYLIFDEADRLINNEFWPDIQIILEKLPKQRRTGLFSATLSAAKIADLIKMGLRNPVKISIKTETKQQDAADKIMMPQSLINLYKVLPNRMEKVAYLVNYLASKDKNKLKTIIFFNTCASTEYYGSLLQHLKQLSNYQIFSMHGQMKQKKRTKIYDKFKSASNQGSILVTTDVIARGIDFNDVPLVIQFDPPQDPSFFVHRVGRTARSGREGEALILLEESERPFVRYLKSNQIKMKETTEIIDQVDSFAQINQNFMDVIKVDRDLIEKGKSAFVSFIRSYKEHKLQLIFQFDKLNLGKVAQSFFLLRIPRVKEILGKKIDFTQSETNPHEIEFIDKNKQKQFNEKKVQKDIKLQEKQDKIVQQKKQLYQNKYMGKELNIKNNKTLRKKVKRIHDDEEEDQMDEELRLMKKLKSGKITKKDFDLRIKQFDPEELQDDESEIV